MAEVKILVEGCHEKVDEAKIKIGATATLIKTDKNIIVDPGYFADKEKLLTELSKLGLKPEDIDIVFLTHLHIDHVANAYLFSNAKIYCKLRKTYPGQAHTLAGGYLERFDLVDGVSIAADVDVLTTPGHTGDMLSLVVSTPTGKVIVAGDAFPSQVYVDTNKLPENNLADDLDEFNTSRKKILEIADYIIPGHGKMFKVEK